MSKKEYAGFWVRLGARLIDRIILILLFYGFILLGVTLAFLLNFLVLIIPFYIGGILLGPFYYTYMTSKYGATFGKRLIGLKVVDKKGNNLTYSRAFVRWLGHIVNIFTLALGYFWIGWDKKKQGFHDKMAQSYVISVKSIAPHIRKKYGGFWIRTGAFFIDWTIIGILNLPITFIGWKMGAFYSSNDLTMYFLFSLLHLPIPIFYMIYFTGKTGQTFGKKWLGLKVVDHKGKVIGYKRAFYRLLGHYVSYVLTVGIGYLIITIDNQRQGLHDKIAKSFVIKIKK